MARVLKNFLAAKIMGFAMTALLVPGTLARSDPILDTLNGQRALYFSRNAAALPIILPQEERPGDVYLTPVRGFISRSDTCFPKLQTSESNSVLPDSIEDRQRNASGKLKIDIGNLGDAMLGGGFKSADKFSISFSDVVTRDATNVALRRALLDAKANDCQKELVKILTSKSTDYYWNRIPWILQTVIYAKENYSFVRARSSTVGIEAEIPISAAVRRLGIPVSLTFSVKAGQSAISGIRMKTNQAYPVAYRPAFVSIDHVKKLKQIAKRGLPNILNRLFNSDAKNQKALVSIRADYIDALTCPKAILAEMTAGRAEPFDSDNEEHRVYILNVGLLLAASFEMCR